MRDFGVIKPKSINAYIDYIVFTVEDGEPVRYFWTERQRRHVLADLANIVAQDLRSKE